MTKQDVTYSGTPVQYHRHPTPIEMRHAIMAALHADYERAERVGDPLIPIRVYKLIGDAITRACDEHEAGGVQ